MNKKPENMTDEELEDKIFKHEKELEWIQERLQALYTERDARQTQSSGSCLYRCCKRK